MQLQTFGAFCWAMLSIALQGSSVIQAQSSSTVTGIVRYGDSGKPAAGVRLWLVPASEPAGVLPDPKTLEDVIKEDGGQKINPTLVAADGSFVLKGVPSGTYFVRTVLLIFPRTTLFTRLRTQPIPRWESCHRVTPFGSKSA